MSDAAKNSHQLDLPNHEENPQRLPVGPNIGGNSSGVFLPLARQPSAGRVQRDPSTTQAMNKGKKVLGKISTKEFSGRKGWRKMLTEAYPGRTVHGRVPGALFMAKILKGLLTAESPQESFLEGSYKRNYLGRI